MLDEAERAHADAAAAQRTPQGRVRFSCPAGAVALVTPLLTEYLVKYPDVALDTIVTNRRVDLIEERVDVAFRVRTTLDDDASLTIRILGHGRRVLVADPTLAETIDASAGTAALDGVPTLSTDESAASSAWELTDPAGQVHLFRHVPRLACGDFQAIREACEAGLGVAFLPRPVVQSSVDAGRLAIVLPGWHSPQSTAHLAFTARRGLPPAVRALIDLLSERLGDSRVLDASRC